MNTHPTHPDLRLARGKRARAEILRAAESIFAGAGLKGARMDAIARRARVNKALLYYYFKSKDDLFREAMENAIERSHQRLMDVLSSPGPPREVLRNYLETQFDLISSVPDASFLLQRFLMTDSRLAERVMRKFFMPRQRKLAALIDRGIRERVFRRVNSSQMGISLTALVVFYFWGAPMLKAATHTDPFRPAHLKERKREVLDFVRHGLFREVR
ncbi:MAG: TetR/AcrR family transcriptional regulator [Terriglobia bacterium]